MRRRTIPPVGFAIAALALAVATCDDPSGPAPVDLEPAALTITDATMRAWIARIADDSTRGRETPSAGLDRAANAIADYLQDLGLAPFFGVSYQQRFSYDDGTAPNVAAVLPGREPGFRDEYVIILAHLDHKGIATTAPVGLDSILNGADDNASGVAAVLELARAFVALDAPPRRSLVFLLVSGEEHGLLGARYFVTVDSLRLYRMVGAVNFDMISRNAPDSLLVAGLTASTMGDAVHAGLGEHPALGLGLRDIVSGGSDHVAFWERGIPFLMFHAGLHPDYHKVTDEVGLVDADKAARVARLGFYVAYAVADTRERPSWYPGWPAPPATGPRGPAPP